MAFKPRYREPRFAKAALHFSDNSFGFWFRRQRPARSSPRQNFSISAWQAPRTGPSPRVASSGLLLRWSWQATLWMQQTKISMLKMARVIATLMIENTAIHMERDHAAVE